ncbi:MAG: hypothetical protein QM680_00735 [Luteolibacter sp.]
MNSKSLSTILFVVMALLLGIWSGVSILVNPTGGIAGLSKLTTLICIAAALINPRIGLYVLAFQAMYIDEMKRLGVYYGAESLQTVQEILVGPILTLCALNLGLLVHVMLGRAKMSFLGWSLYGIGVALGLYYLTGGAIGGGDSFAKRLYNAAAASSYTTVIPLAYAFFKEIKDWVKFLSFQTLLTIPSAAWAIWQYFNGFNNLEWTYALSGLSPVHSGQMLAFEHPRVFGFFGSASAMGCLCIYVTFCVWRAISIRDWRWVFVLTSLLLFAALICSTQRSALLSPFIFGIVIFCYRSRFKTIALYGTLAAMFVIGVLNSTWLLNEGLDKINTAISSDGKWGSEVLKVSTFSDRLYGWERLKRPESWSLFGTGETTSSFQGNEKYGVNYSHDMINRSLMKVGAVGLAAILAIAGTIAWSLHRLVWRLPDKSQRILGALSLGTSVPICLMSAAGGDNFTATPYNLAIWSALAGVFVLKRSVDSGQFSETPEIGEVSDPQAEIKTAGRFPAPRPLALNSKR